MDLLKEFVVPSTPIDPERVKWIRARTLFLHHMFEEAREITRTCTWPEAVWFENMCRVHDILQPETYEDYRMILSLHTNDIKACVLRALLEEDSLLIEHLAERGDALAQSAFGELLPEYSDLEYYMKSANQDEPEGLYNLGKEIKSEYSFIGKCCFKRAAELGFFPANMPYAETFNRYDVERYRWAVKSITEGVYSDILTFQKWIFVLVEEAKCSVSLFYHIGEIVDPHIDIEKQELFEIRNWKDIFVIHSYYTQCNQKTRVSILAWCLCARRMGISKDVRFIISQLVWESRKDGIYEMEN